MSMKKISKEFLISIVYSLVIPAILYFLLKLFQSNYHVITSLVDKRIPFIPYFIYIYILFFPFIIIVLYMIFIKDKKKYYRGINASLLGLIITDIIFLIYPTIMNRPIVTNDIDIITRTVLNITYFFDTPAINCFPSIHSLLCFQVAYMSITCNNMKLKYKIMTTIMSLLVISSTVLVKQHYFYDILGAFIIFIISNIIAINYKKMLTNNR